MTTHDPIRYSSVRDDWRGLHRLAAVAALLIPPISLLDIALSFSASTGTHAAGALTAVDWFALYQRSAWLGLRNLGFWNMLTTALSLPIYLALFAAHWRAHRCTHRAFAALAAVIFFTGAAIYIGNNKAIPMLTLSRQYHAAADPADQAQFAAAGQALLAQAEDFSPGAYPGFFFTEVAALLMSGVMLRGGVFGRWTARSGLLGFGLMFIFTTCATFIPASFDLLMPLAILGGLLIMAWYLLTARRLFQL